MEKSRIRRYATPIKNPYFERPAGTTYDRGFASGRLSSHPCRSSIGPGSFLIFKPGLPLSQARAHSQHPRSRRPSRSMSSASPLSHAATAKAAEAALPAPVSSSSPSTANSLPRRGTLREFLMTEVDPDLSTIPLAAYCFMTGWMFVSAPVLSPSLTLHS